MKVSMETVVGVDLGNKKHEICQLNRDGDKVLSKSIKNELAAITEFFDRFDIPAKVLVAMECGSVSPWVSELLRERGFRVYVGNARKLRAIWDTDNKSDVRDAEMLARIARFDLKLLHPIKHRNRESQMDLNALKVRDAVVRNRTVLINSVRGLCKSSGISLASCSSGSFSTKNKAAIPVELQPALLPLLTMIEAQTKLISHYDKLIEKLCEKYKETENLRQIPGVGPLTALGFVLTLEAPERFAKSRDVGPFLGLVPRRDQSGDTDKPLRISKAGNGYLRRLLVSASCYIMGPFGPPCDLRRYGESFRFGRIGKGESKIKKRKAKVAVARKLAVVLHCLWKTGEAYDPDYKHRIKRQKQAA